MPLVTLSQRAPVDPAQARAILDQVHSALVASGVPQADRFQRVLELDADRLVVDARYPDLARDRSDRFVLIEILWSVGRNVKIKRKVATDIANGVARVAGIDAADVMVVFVETAWENWSFSGGRLLNAD
jgi:phenylpyruvate tautomerase PptA (4-oxalocrotonate tautomerase family)